jgi:tetratricopeptide (TPR) repeat protein
LIYILLVAIIWAITFPLIFWKKDWIFSKITYFWSPPGYDLAKTENLIGKGDSYLLPHGKPWTTKFKEFLSADESPELPPLDIELLKKACDYYSTREHRDPFLDSPSWNEKRNMLSSKNHIVNEEILLTFDPKIYWKENLPYVLQALDYYKRALNFSGPDIRVPERIETAAVASCRYSEILMAYTIHVYQTEEFIQKKYLKDELGRENPLSKPSWFRKVWNWIRRKKSTANRLPLASNLSPKQVQLRTWDKLRRGEIYEITKSEFIRSIGKTLRNLSIPLDQSSPIEALEMYERLLFFSTNQDSPIEFRRYRKYRGEIFLRLAKENSANFEKAILEFKDATTIANQSDIPPEVMATLLVENFALELGIAKVYFQQKKFQECIFILNELQSKLGTVDERSTVDTKMDQRNLLKEFRFYRKTTLRQLGRYEEADEIPDE